MEREELVRRLLERQSGCCFICELPLDPTLDKIEVDHIIPRAGGEKVRRTTTPPHTTPATATNLTAIFE